MTAAEILEAMRSGEILRADDHLLLLGDPAQVVSAGVVRQMIQHHLIRERVLATDYSVFDVIEPDAPTWYTDDSYIMADVG